MAWFRMDDGFHNHPKTIAAGTAAAGLFARCGSYAAQHLTDGFVPAAIARQYGTATMIKRLIEVGYWTADRDGYLMHDYLDYNPSRSKVEEDRARTAERVANYRAKKTGNAVTNANRNAVTAPTRNAVTNGAPSPSRPDPVGVGSGWDGSSRSETRERPVDNFRPALRVVCDNRDHHARLGDGTCIGCEGDRKAAGA